MRLYKANLDNSYKIISYVMPQQVESIYSFHQDETYDISLEYICDYIELNGYITIVSKETNDISYIMFLDVDYNFISNEIGRAHV